MERLKGARLLIRDRDEAGASIGVQRDILDQPVFGLRLSVRANNCLKERGISTIGELTRLTECELLSLPNLGKGTLKEIADALARLGLRLGVVASRGFDVRTRESFTPTWPGLTAEGCRSPGLSAPVAPDLAVLNLLRKFGARDYAVIKGRIIEGTATLEQLGAHFDVTRERIRQIERKLRSRLQGYVASPGGEWARDLARKVRTELGTAVPADYLRQYFVHLCSSVQSDDDRIVITGFLLWIAGPYEAFGEWRIAGRDLASATRDALTASEDGRGWIAPESATKVLLKAGIVTSHHGQWLRTIGFFEMEGGWLPRLSNIPDRVEQILRCRQRPVTAEELLPLVNCENVRSLRSRLLEDDRFKRTSKQGHFALREWSEYDEYTGIADEIAEEIARQGGVADAQYLIEVISQRYGVKPGSVHQYLSAPMFIKVEKGYVRLRAPDEMKTIRADPRLCPGLYRVNEQWVLRVKVTGETLRGSGRALHPSVAALVGCQPGERRAFKSPMDEIIVSWPAGSACGPNLGSLRPDVEFLGGAIDDYVFLTFGVEVIGVRLLKKAELEGRSKDVRLMLLVGLSSSTPGAYRWRAIASAVGLRTEAPPSPEDVHGHLMRRNEVALAHLIDLPELEDPEQVFAYLEDTLGL